MQKRHVATQTKVTETGIQTKYYTSALRLGRIQKKTDYEKTKILVAVEVGAIGKFKSPYVPAKAKAFRVFISSSKKLAIIRHFTFLTTQTKP